MMAEKGRGLSDQDDKMTKDDGSWVCKVVRCFSVYFLNKQYEIFFFYVFKRFSCKERYEKLMRVTAVMNTSAGIGVSLLSMLSRYCLATSFLMSCNQFISY